MSSARRPKDLLLLMCVCSVVYPQLDRHSSPPVDDVADILERYGQGVIPEDVIFKGVAMPCLAVCPSGSRLVK
eukprot:11259794-Heterocapsa_arctica.AAC.1